MVDTKGCVHLFLFLFSKIQESSIAQLPENEVYFDNSWENVNLVQSMGF